MCALSSLMHYRDHYELSATIAFHILSDHEIMCVLHRFFVCKVPYGGKDTLMAVWLSEISN